MHNQKNIHIRISVLQKRQGVGTIHYHNNMLEPHEKSTIECLAKYGYDIETIVPSNMPGSYNPDILMLGTFWEIKGPTSINEDTIKKRFRKATKQAGGKAVFDLRNISKDVFRKRVENTIIDLFVNSRGMRRSIIIKSGEDILDISK